LEPAVPKDDENLNAAMLLTEANALGRESTWTGDKKPQPFT